ncbi:hypothetical protein Hanom_Chr05g00454111 [Helianthus anomalus]
MCRQRQIILFLALISLYPGKSKMTFSSLRFVQFCDFHPKVCFSTTGFKKFEILPFHPAC